MVAPIRCPHAKCAGAFTCLLLLCTSCGGKTRWPKDTLANPKKNQEPVYKLFNKKLQYVLCACTMKAYLMMIFLRFSLVFRQEIKRTSTTWMNLNLATSYIQIRNCVAVAFTAVIRAPDTVYQSTPAQTTRCITSPVYFTARSRAVYARTSAIKSRTCSSDACSQSTFICKNKK